MSSTLRCSARRVCTAAGTTCREQSYVHAMSVVFTCTMIVFGALIAYAGVLLRGIYLRTKEDARLAKIELLPVR